MTKTFCDVCGKEIVGTADECVICDWDEGEFHPKCLIVINGKEYCPKHATAAKNDQMIRKYIGTVWKEVGFEEEVEDGNISARVGPLNLKIEPEYDDTGEKEIHQVVLKVDGLAQSTRKFKTNLHSHEGIVKKLQSEIVKSLRGTKASITSKKKQLDTQLEETDEVINLMLKKLGGKLVKS